MYLIKKKVIKFLLKLSSVFSAKGELYNHKYNQIKLTKSLLKSPNLKFDFDKVVNCGWMISYNSPHLDITQEIIIRME